MNIQKDVRRSKEVNYSIHSRLPGGSPTAVMEARGRIARKSGRELLADNSATR
jgi:hypothetical protein